MIITSLVSLKLVYALILVKQPSIPLHSTRRRLALWSSKARFPVAGHKGDLRTRSTRSIHSQWLHHQRRGQSLASSMPSGSIKWFLEGKKITAMWNKLMNDNIMAICSKSTSIIVRILKGFIHLQACPPIQLFPLLLTIMFFFMNSFLYIKLSVLPSRTQYPWKVCVSHSIVLFCAQDWMQEESPTTVTEL